MLVLFCTKTCCSLILSWFRYQLGKKDILDVQTQFFPLIHQLGDFVGAECMSSPHSVVTIATEPWNHHPQQETEFHVMLYSTTTIINISFMCVCESLSCVWLFVTLWTVVCQAPLSMEFSGRNTGVGCDTLLQGNFPTQGLNPGLLHHGQICCPSHPYILI